MVKRVDFADGSRLPDADAEVVEAELVRIADERGFLTPRVVVDAARDQRSALYSYFEWDDRAAADEYRLSQARHLIRSVQVRVLDVNSREVRVAKYHNVTVQRRDDTSKTERVYAPLAVVQRSDTLVEQVRKQVEEQLLSARRKWEVYRHIPEFHQRFARIFTEVDETLGRAAD